MVGAIQYDIDYKSSEPNCEVKLLKIKGGIGYDNSVVSRAELGT